MAEKKNFLTDKGLKKIQDELQELIIVKRKEITQKIKEAKEQGDLSENAEYDAAREEQKNNEARIAELEAILKNAEVINMDEVDKEKVNIGCKVKVKRVDNGKEDEYKIKGSTEADFLNKKISNESPIGAALMGRKVGEKVDVETPNGTFQLEVLEISLDDEE